MSNLHNQIIKLNVTNLCNVHQYNYRLYYMSWTINFMLDKNISIKYIVDLFISLI